MTGVVVVSWIVFAFAVAVVLICASVLLQRWADKKARKEEKHGQRKTDDAHGRHADGQRTGRR